MVQSCLIVLVVGTIAGSAPVSGTADAGVLPAFVLCLAYFLGTVLFVKTMIRERGNPAYRRWSVGYHLLALAPAAWASPWATVLFAWLLVRAMLLPGRRLNPMRVGLIEFANSALLLACVALL